MPKKSIINSCNLNKSIIITCIATYENVYMLCNDYVHAFNLPYFTQLPSLDKDKLQLYTNQVKYT